MTQSMAEETESDQRAETKWWILYESMSGEMRLIICYAGAPQGILVWFARGQEFVFT